MRYQHTMSFGRYRGLQVWDVQSDYLRWAIEHAEGISDWERYCLEHELAERQKHLQERVASLLERLR
jgi:predicted DNA-binding protein